MEDLIKMQSLQIEALQKELEKKNDYILKAREIINALYDVMIEEQTNNIEVITN